MRISFFYILPLLLSLSILSCSSRKVGFYQGTAPTVIPRTQTINCETQTIPDPVSGEEICPAEDEPKSEKDGIPAAPTVLSEREICESKQEPEAHIWREKSVPPCLTDLEARRFDCEAAKNNFMPLGEGFVCISANEIDDQKLCEERGNKWLKVYKKDGSFQYACKTMEEVYWHACTQTLKEFYDPESMDCIWGERRKIFNACKATKGYTWHRKKGCVEKSTALIPQ